MKGPLLSWAILQRFKPVENRTRCIRLGWVALHTGDGQMDLQHWRAALPFSTRLLSPSLPLLFPSSHHPLLLILRSLSPSPPLTTTPPPLPFLHSLPPPLHALPLLAATFQTFARRPGVVLPDVTTLPKGCIVGAMRIDRKVTPADCQGTASELWAMAKHTCFVIGAVVEVKVAAIDPRPSLPLYPPSIQLFNCYIYPLTPVTPYQRCSPLPQLDEPIKFSGQCGRFPITGSTTYKDNPAVLLPLPLNLSSWVHPRDSS